MHQNPLSQPLWHDVRYSEVHERLRFQSESRAVAVHDIPDSYLLCVDIKVYCIIQNRPLYRYGGHIEFIGFKEYYGMRRGYEHDLKYSHQYLRALFGQIFLKVFLEKDCNEKKRSLCRLWM